MQKKFPLRDPVIKGAVFLDPERRNSVSYSDVKKLLAIFPGVVSEGQSDLLFDEYASYQIAKDMAKDGTFEGERVDEIWHHIGQVKEPSSTAPMYPTLVTLARFLLLLPHSNAYCETLFNVVRKVSTDVRSQLGKNTKEGRSATSVYATSPDDTRNTLVGILASKVNIFSDCACCEWKPSKDLLAKAKSATHANLSARQAELKSD